MPNSNSILNLLNITDTNIKISDVFDSVIHLNGQKLHIKVVGFSTLIKNGARKTETDA